MAGKGLVVCAFVYTQYRNVSDRQTDRSGISISRSACYM